jgi:hypothetical protein
LGKPVGFESANSNDDFNSGFFAASINNDLKIKVFGFDDGERVAKKVFYLDPTRNSSPLAASSMTLTR